MCQAPHETLRETSCCPAVAVLKAYLGSIQPYAPSLISLMVSVDVKHHAYLLLPFSLTVPNNYAL